jgi:hypothetical protein
MIRYQTLFALVVVATIAGVVSMLLQFLAVGLGELLGKP